MRLFYVPKFFWYGIGVALWPKWSADWGWVKHMGIGVDHPFICHICWGENSALKYWRTEQIAIFLVKPSRCTVEHHTDLYMSQKSQAWWEARGKSPIPRNSDEEIWAPWPPKTLSLPGWSCAFQGVGTEFTNILLKPWKHRWKPTTASTCHIIVHYIVISKSHLPGLSVEGIPCEIS